MHWVPVNWHSITKIGFKFNSPIFSSDEIEVTYFSVVFSTIYAFLAALCTTSQFVTRSLVISFFMPVDFRLLIFTEGNKILKK